MTDHHARARSLLATEAARTIWSVLAAHSVWDACKRVVDLFGEPHEPVTMALSDAMHAVMRSPAAAAGAEERPTGYIAHLHRCMKQLEGELADALREREAARAALSLEEDARRVTTSTARGLFEESDRYRKERDAAGDVLRAACDAWDKNPSAAEMAAVVIAERDAARAEVVELAAETLAFMDVPAGSERGFRLRKRIAAVLKPPAAADPLRPLSEDEMRSVPKLTDAEIQAAVDRGNRDVRRARGEHVSEPPAAGGEEG